MARKDALLAEKNIKIRALTHEVAYYRRIRYGKVSEALSGDQRSLFDETVDMDVAAIEAELEGEQPASRTKRKHTGRRPLPPEPPCIELRHDTAFCQCSQCCAGLSRSMNTLASS